MNIKGKIFSICSLIITSSILLVCSSCSSFSESEQVTLNVYNWGNYISQGIDGGINVNEQFTKETGIKVNYTTFATNEELYAKLAGKGANFDVIIPSDYMIAKLISKNMLYKPDFSKMPNTKLIDDNFLNPNYDPTSEYSIPYTWGCIGIFYNKNMVDETEEQIDWDIFWKEKYKDKMLMFDNSRDAFFIAQKLLDININSTNPDDWYRAADLLKLQKPLVQSYVMDQIYSKMGNNEAAIAPYYSGDAAMLMADNPNVGFVIPKSGTNIFVDAMCILNDSKHKTEAQEYINFMCRPDIAYANIKEVGYSTPISEVKSMLNPSISQNPIYYPDDEIINKSQSFGFLPENISSLMDQLWIQIKTGEADKTAQLIFVLLGFLFIYITVIIYKKSKKQ